MRKGLARNARLRIEGTRNLVAAAKAANVKRMIAQSIAFIYAPGPGARVETDPMKAAEGATALPSTRFCALEEAALSMPEGLVLRYGYLYGPGTWSNDKVRVRRRCMSTARRGPRCSRSRAARPASTMSPKTTALCRARRPSGRSASMPGFACRS